MVVVMVMVNDSGWGGSFVVARQEEHHKNCQWSSLLMQATRALDRLNKDIVEQGTGQRIEYVSRVV